MDSRAWNCADISTDPKLYKIFFIISNKKIVVECSVLDVCFSFDVGRSMFDLPAMPLGGLGRMSSCLGPVTMIILPSSVMHGRRVFDVHLSKHPRMA